MNHGPPTITQFNATNIPMVGLLVAHFMITRKCLICGKEFGTYISKIKNGRGMFCSVVCRGVWYGQTFLKEKHPMWKGGKKIIKCIYCDKIFGIKYSQLKAQNFCSRKCWGMWRSENMKGEKAGGWKNGNTNINKSIRGSKNNRDWRRQVFIRDNWTCQECGDKSRKGNRIIIHAHHIKSFKDYQELRFDVTNGLTLCKTCHAKKPHIRGKANHAK